MGRNLRFFGDEAEDKKRARLHYDCPSQAWTTAGGGGPAHLTALLQLLAPSYSLFERDERTRGAGNGGGAPWPPPMPPSASPSPSLPTRGHLSLHGCDRSLVTKLAMIGGFFGGLGNLRGSFPNKEPPTHPPKSVVLAVGEYGEEYSGAPMLLQRL